MIKTCRICFENKECLSFPCCNNNFDICKTCLETCPRTCPHCRKSFRVDNALVTIKRKTCDCWQALTWLTYLATFAMIAYTFAIIIKRNNKCRDQPCHDVLPCVGGCPTYPNKCECGAEILDIIFFLIFGILPFFVLTYLVHFKTYCQNSKIKKLKLLFFECLIFVSSCIIYLVINDIHNIYNKYNEDNYEAKFIDSWLFLLTMYVSIPLVVIALWFSCKWLLKCIPETLCKTDEIQVSNPTIVTINQENTQPEKYEYTPKQLDYV